MKIGGWYCPTCHGNNWSATKRISVDGKMRIYRRCLNDRCLLAVALPPKGADERG